MSTTSQDEQTTKTKIATAIITWLNGLIATKSEEVVQAVAEEEGSSVHSTNTDLTEGTSSTDNSTGTKQSQNSSNTIVVEPVDENPEDENKEDQTTLLGKGTSTSSLQQPDKQKPITLTPLLEDSMNKLTYNVSLQTRIFNELFKRAGLGNLDTTIDTSSSTKSGGSTLRVVSTLRKPKGGGRKNGLADLVYSGEYRNFDAFVKPGELREENDFITSFTSQLKTKTVIELLNSFKNAMTSQFNPDKSIQNLSTYYTNDKIGSFDNPSYKKDTTIDTYNLMRSFDSTQQTVEGPFAKFEAIIDNQISDSSWTNNIKNGIHKPIAQENRGIRFDKYFTILSTEYATDKAKNQKKKYAEEFQKALRAQFNADIKNIQSLQTAEISFDINTKDIDLFMHQYILYRRLKPYRFFLNKLETEPEPGFGNVEYTDAEEGDTEKIQQHLYMPPYTYNVVMDSADRTKYVISELYTNNDSGKRWMHILVLTRNQESVDPKYKIQFMASASDPDVLYRVKPEELLPVPIDPKDIPKPKQETEESGESETWWPGWNASKDTELSRKEIIDQNATALNEIAISHIRLAEKGVGKYLLIHTDQYIPKKDSTGTGPTELDDDLQRECMKIFNRYDLSKLYKHLPGFLDQYIEDNE